MATAEFLIEAHMESGAPGVCYAGVIERRCWVEVFLRVFSWPELDDLVRLDASWFRGLVELDALVLVAQGGGLYHVEEAHLVDDEDEVVPFMTMVHRLIDGRCWPSGSFADLHARGSVSQGTVGVCRVGGSPPMPIVPSDLSPESVLAFNRAVSCYYEAQLCGVGVFGVSAVGGADGVDAHFRGSAVDPVGGSGVVETGAREVCAGDGATSAGLTESFRLPRGPNYLRNQEARMRKRVQKEERKLATAALRGKLDVLEQVHSGGPRGRAVRTESEQKLHDLKVRRQIIQEQRKLDRLESPVAIIEEAMRMVGLAGNYAKAANDYGVAGWAATLAASHAESIARTAPSSLRSLDSVTSARSVPGSVGSLDSVTSARGAAARKVERGGAASGDDGVKSAGSRLGTGGTLADRQFLAGVRPADPGAELGRGLERSSRSGSSFGSSVRSVDTPYLGSGQPVKYARVNGKKVVDMRTRSYGPSGQMHDGHFYPDA